MNKKIKNNKRKYKNIIAENIINQSITATSWLLCSIFEFGAITIKAFLSPSLYADFPSSQNLFFDDVIKAGKKAKYKEITIRQSLRRLEKYGFIERNEAQFIITKKGKEFLNQLLKKKKQSRKMWDKKYRVVIFDIPETKRKSRNWLRAELYLLGYKRLQNSVFIGKKTLPEDIILGIKENKISNFVNYLLVDRVYKNIF
ncbi:MAG TPA: CRISPR-associated endonuclease Cas2 [Candidatus Moranbacteria bacterium]|nr:CRISPR-associated endonuclease Cas2 [Candidatus Moranbacteria bacterium]